MEPLCINPNIAIAQIMSNKPSKNYGNIPAMFLGRYTSDCICRIVFRVPITSLPQNAAILKAKFDITSFSNTMGSPPQKVTPYALTENWSVDTVNWDNQPAFNTEIYGESLNMCKGMQHEFDITSIVRKWYSNEIPNYGIVLKSDEIKDGTYIRLVTNTSRSFGPSIDITYQLKSKCVCEVIPTKFIEELEVLDTNESYIFSIARDTSLTKTVTYFIENLGENSVAANLQVSPDGVNFVEDSERKIIKNNKTTILIPYVFAKYTRIRVKTIDKNKKSKVKIWYQAQK